MKANFKLFIHHLIFCILDEKQCTFSNGTLHTGSAPKMLGETNTENECASLVIAQSPAATGATWKPSNKTCWASFGKLVVSDPNHRSCLFTAGNNF